MKDYPISNVIRERAEDSCYFDIYYVNVFPKLYIMRFFHFRQDFTKLRDSGLFGTII